MEFARWIIFFVCVLSSQQSLDALMAAMAIDFGSQFMKFALVKPGVPMEIVLNKESRRKTPALIAFKDGERLFSDYALAYAIKRPEYSFGYILDLIGKRIDNPIVKLYRKRFPFVKLEADDTRKTVKLLVGDEAYSPETLIAMLLQNAQAVVEDFAKQSVRDVVISVPPFFNQAERQALITAVNITDLNLLQLMNQNSATGLNYGMFRRKQIEEKAQTLLVYDMGAGSTVASLIEFRLEKEKNSDDKNPIVITLGLGYNRTLGGLELSMRLRDLLVEEFRKQVKTEKDITTSARAMTKLLKEAERLKEVLSGNNDHFAQIEGVHEEHDFRLKVTREQFESLISDLEKDLIKPILDALSMAEFEIDQVDQVVLMGASTRVPFVQAAVKKFFKDKELGKFLNTDEAIAMGAVYRAAHYSQGFKVKKFSLKDLQIFPIQVDFTAPQDQADEGGHNVRRTICGYKTFYPTTNKIISFSSFKDDFSLNVNYGDLKHISDVQLGEFDSQDILNLELKGIKEAINTEMKKEGTVFKGVKAYFRVDDSGVMRIPKAEVIFEREPTARSTFSAIADSITGLFSVNHKDKANSKEELEEDLSKEVKVEILENMQLNQIINENALVNKTGEELKVNATNGLKNINATAEKIMVMETVKIPLDLKEQVLFMLLQEEEIHAARKRLEDFAKKERLKAEREAAHHSIESLVYDLAAKFDEPDFMVFTTATEKDTIEVEVEKARSWLEDEVNLDTTVEEFKSRRKAIDVLLKPINKRIKEEKERPTAVSNLMMLLNRTESFLEVAQNLTELEIFTPVEIDVLKKKLDETKVWFEEKNRTQSALKPTDTPAYTVYELSDMARDLDRELRYLFTKLNISKSRLDKMMNETLKANNSTQNETTTDSGKPEKEPTKVNASGNFHDAYEL